MRGISMTKAAGSLAVCLAICVPLANADSVPIASGFSENGLGTFTGSLTYDAPGGVAGLLTVSLTNTSPLANGGFITGFAFNIDDSDAGATAAFIDVDTASTTGVNESDFDNSAGNDLDFNPFGLFLAGADRQGNPNFGVGVGETGVFEFDVDPKGVALTAIDFISEISPGNGGNGKDFAFVVRFNGFEDDGSDKVAGRVVPLPIAAWMGIAMLGSLGLVRKIRR